MHVHLWHRTSVLCCSDARSTDMAELKLGPTYEVHCYDCYYARPI